MRRARAELPKTSEGFENTIRWSRTPQLFWIAAADPSGLGLRATPQLAGRRYWLGAPLCVARFPTTFGLADQFVDRVQEGFA